jgi:hypothetical protein
MDESELEALLGRPLTPTENTNKDLYLEIAKESLEELLCISLDSGSEEEESRTFEIREGYSTVFTDIFKEISEVKVDGATTEDYYPAFWDKRSNPYYNSIVLAKAGNTAEITAVWGFSTVPNDLKLLWAQAFANVSKKYVPGSDNVKSKQVEDFRVSYGDLTDDEAFINANKRTMAKYSMCNVGYVRHGDTC